MTIATLRKLIRSIENRPLRTGSKIAVSSRQPWVFGVEDIDQRLRDSQLCAHAFHDISAHHPGDRIAAGGFALALLSRLPDEGDILWCQLVSDGREYGTLYGPGLRWLGIDPGRLIHVRVTSLRDMSWVMEEGLRSGCLAAVLSEGPALDFTATRRLSLACEDTSVPCLYINLNGEMRSSAADTRWHITARTGPDIALDDLVHQTGPETAAWSLSLVKCRGGRLGKWQLQWNYETVSFHMAPALCDRKVLAPATGEGKIIALQRAG